MKERILYNWNITRVIYVIIGTFVLVQSAGQGQWPGIILGLYFVSMGLFAFGCAAGNCFGGQCLPDQKQDSNSTDEIEYKEVKSE